MAWFNSWWFLGGCLVLLVTLAYSNSLNGEFLYDDNFDVLGNLPLRRLWPLPETLRLLRFLSHHPRPVAQVTFALNFAFGGQNSTLPFHLTNVVIHILGTLALFGVLRRTLALPMFLDGLGRFRGLLAFVSAALWGLHPLQTESVAYITQRYESLMGLFCLTTFYCLLRRWGAPRTAEWTWAAGVSCLLALWSKEVALALPILVVLFDQIFLSRSWKEGWERNKFLYLGLLIALAGFAIIQLNVPHRTFAGWNPEMLPWWKYALSQFGVLLHYLRLAFWPSPLVFDYIWPVAEAWYQVVPGLLVIGVLVGLSLWGIWRRSGWGFLGACFFLPLGPTSSVMPILDLAVEHRMYLSLAPLVVGAVLAGAEGVRRLMARGLQVAMRVPVIAVLGALLALLGSTTYLRNEDYRGPISLWVDTIVKRPDNYRAHLNLGAALENRGFIDETIKHLERAAILAPGSQIPHLNLGAVYTQVRRNEEALAQFHMAVELAPTDPRGWSGLAACYLETGKVKEAEACAQKAIGLDPDQPEGHLCLGRVYCMRGAMAEASACFERAAAANPYQARTRWNAGVALLGQGRMAEAELQFQKAIRLEPDPWDALSLKGRILYQAGHAREAVQCWQEVLEKAPEHKRTKLRMAWAYATHPDDAFRDGKRAIDLALAVKRSQSEETPLLMDTLAAAYAAGGDFQQAAIQAKRAMDLSTGIDYTLTQAIGKRYELYLHGIAYRDRVLDSHYKQMSCP